ncbi:MAG: hypothetical protein IJB69_09700 [Clostridia bacterium]|nr:hypothetical protein [Clostridia bacterium]
MYTKQDFDDLTAQLKKRRLVLSVPCVLLLGGIVFSLCIRLMWLTITLTILLGIVAIFGHTMFLSPVSVYRRHVDHALYGRVRKTEGCLKEMEENAVWRDGLMLVPLIINIGDMKNEEDDRLFYFDGRRPHPGWEMGQQLCLTSYDKLITAWETKSNE